MEEDDVLTNVPLDSIKKGDYYIVYAHPETLVENTGISKLLRSRVFRQKVCCTVIDEVHMVAEWYVI